MTSGAIAAIVATMAGLGHFWIAHILFGALILGTLYAGVVKACAYRKGL